MHELNSFPRAQELPFIGDALGWFLIGLALVVGYWLAHRTWRAIRGGR